MEEYTIETDIKVEPPDIDDTSTPEHDDGCKIDTYIKIEPHNIEDAFIPDQSNEFKLKTNIKIEAIDVDVTFLPKQASNRNRGLSHSDQSQMIGSDVKKLSKIPIKSENVVKCIANTCDAMVLNQDFNQGLVMAEPYHIKKMECKTKKMRKTPAEYMRKYRARKKALKMAATQKKQSKNGGSPIIVYQYERVLNHVNVAVPNADMHQQKSPDPNNIVYSTFVGNQIQPQNDGSLIMIHKYERAMNHANTADVQTDVYQQHSPQPAEANIDNTTNGVHQEMNIHYRNLLGNKVPIEQVNIKNTIKPSKTAAERMREYRVRKKALKAAIANIQPSNELYEAVPLKEDVTVINHPGPSRISKNIQERNPPQPDYNSIHCSLLGKQVQEQENIKNAIKPSKTPAEHMREYRARKKTLKAAIANIQPSDESSAAVSCNGGAYPINHLGASNMSAAIQEQNSLQSHSNISNSNLDGNQTQAEQENLKNTRKTKKTAAERMREYRARKKILKAAARFRSEFDFMSCFGTDEELIENQQRGEFEEENNKLIKSDS